MVNERRNELEVSGIAKPYQAIRRYPWATLATPHDDGGGRIPVFGPVYVFLLPATDVGSTVRSS